MDLVDELAARQLSVDYGVDKDEARRRVVEQDDIEIISGEVRARVGPDAWGGSWIDHTHEGRLHLAVRQSSVDDAEEVLATKGASGRTSVLAVPRSLTDLQRNAEAVEASLESAGISFGLATVDVENNGLLVGLGSSEGDETSANAERLVDEVLGNARDGSGEQVAVRYEYGLQREEAAACATSFMACDKPMPGGLEIRDNVNGSTCTAGFVVQSKVDTKKYMMTAGHCIDYDASHPSSDVWMAAPSNANPASAYTLGRPHPGRVFHDSTHDVAIIRLWAPEYVGTPPADTAVLVQASPGPSPTTFDAWYDITAVPVYGDPVVGAYLCKSGGFSRTECSQVNSVLSYDVWMKINDVAVSVCKSDSGGPVYKSHKAYGIIRSVVVSGSETRPTVFSGITTRDCAGTTSYWKYYKSDTALAKTNTKIMP